jgi:hypothetical protein
MGMTRFARFARLRYMREERCAQRAALSPKGAIIKKEDRS